MKFSRRLALGCASAFAAAASTTELSLASIMPATKAETPRTVQRLFQPLIHRDETNEPPYFAMLSIRSADTAWMSIHDLDDSGFRAADEKYRARGYRLRRVSAFQAKAGLRYAAIWQYASGPEQQAHRGLTRADFTRMAAGLAQSGFRLSHVDASSTDAGVRYAAIWERSQGGEQRVFAALTGREYVRTRAELSAQGFRPLLISGHAESGASRYAIVFQKSAASGWEARHRMTASVFAGKARAMQARGALLTDASAHVASGRMVFSGVWERGERA